MNFLHRLALTGLDEARGLRPALPPRYARNASLEPDAFAAPMRTPTARALAHLAAPPAQMGMEHREPAREFQASNAAPVSLTHEPSEPAATQPVSRAVGISLPAVGCAAPLPSAEPPVQPTLSSTASPQRAPQPVERAAMPDRPNAVSHTSVLEAYPEDFAGHTPVLHRSLDQTHREGESAPPVIHVTIDRIDVRTPARVSPRDVKPAPARRAPSQSLGEYLRSRSQ